MPEKVFVLPLGEKRKENFLFLFLLLDGQRIFVSLEKYRPVLVFHS
jgi:hypothetical protein